jgi:hypothetical protein
MVQYSIILLPEGREVEMDFQDQRHVFEDSLVEVRQEFVITADGQVVIPWCTPQATDLILAVWESATDQSFPVLKISGAIYCG